MAYYGTTAASSLANPPVPLNGPLTKSPSSLGNTGRGLTVWAYKSSSTPAQVSVANFISDAYYIGMRPGDLVLGSYFSSAGSSTGYHYRLVCTNVTTSGATFSTGQLSTG